jgi:hypothetical protein
VIAAASDIARSRVTIEARMELRLAWRTWLLPAVLVLCALLAIANVANAAAAVRADYAQLEHTRAEYAANHMDFLADLHKPENVSGKGDNESIGNLARFDYDTLATAIVALSPGSSITESLKYLGFLIYPALFFLIGLWMSTGQRRYRFEKVALVRAGTARTVAARQLALLGIAAIVIASTLLVDVVSRAITQSVLFQQLPLDIFRPRSAAPAQNPLLQWVVILLLTVFFGAGGIAVGSVFGVFALPAIVFVIGNYVIPILGAHDPRNWFEVLGHSVFSYSASFELALPIPLPESTAYTAAGISAAILVGVGYLGMRLRNPRAT